MVVVGSLTIDLTANCDVMPLAGETVLGSQFSMVPGGKGNNQAIAAARLGAATAMVGRIGQDAFGDRVLKQLAADGVDATRVERCAGMATGIAHIRVDRSGQNSIVMVPLANSAMDEEAVAGCAEAIQSARILLTQMEIPLDATRAALRLARAGGVTTVLNPAPAAPIDRSMLALVDVCVPNEFEAKVLTGIDAGTVDGAIRAAHALLQLGCGSVVVTLGERGAVHVDKEGVTVVAALSVTTVDTVAAGDAFCAGLVAALAAGEPRDTALARATAAGALAATVAGATSSLPTKAAVDKLLSESGGPVLTRV
ncbi:MAG: ribokinase [Candidatus Dormibacteria bacterium]